MKGSKDSWAVSVRLATKTNLPLKRVISASLPGGKIVLTETFSKMTLDPKFDAKKFDLPKE